MRLFFAITLPDNLRDDLARATAELRLSVPRVAWVAPDLLHITMKFLGECDESALAPIEQAARAVAASTPPQRLIVAVGGAFPNFLAPRVVWIGMRNTPGLVSLAAELEHALEPLGFAAERRPFRAHITLGRVKNSLPRTECARLEQGLRSIQEVWPLHVAYLSLMQSDLGRVGPRYTTRAELPLGGA